VLDTLIDQLFKQARRDGRREPYEAYAFDALLTMADHAATNSGPSGGDDSTGSDRLSPSEQHSDSRAGGRPRSGESGSLWEPTSDSAGTQPTTATDCEHRDDGAATSGDAPDQVPANPVERIGRRGIPELSGAAAS
jgi:hypothetical protein